MFSDDELYQAYLDCRKHKRCKQEALEFEINLEQNLFILLEEINSGLYKPLPSKCFIVTDPKPREVFAAAFRDRIVHHLIYNEINPYIEPFFNKNIFNCRKDKGVLKGVQTMQEEIINISDNFTKDAWIIKLDIKNFFPSLNKQILFDNLIEFLKINYTGTHFELLVYLLKEIIFQDITKNCIKVGTGFELIPIEKSLFGKSTGLAIGNLTSQLFANFYLISFDLIISIVFGVFGRYVDDVLIVITDKKLIKKIYILQEFLQTIGLQLHPNKIYIQHVTKGCKFIGYNLKYNRIHIGRRTIKKAMNATISKDDILSSINSYLGFIRHCTDFKKQLQIVNRVSEKEYLLYTDPLYLKYMKTNGKHLIASSGKVLTNGKLYAKKVFVTGDPKLWEEVSENDPKYLAFLKMSESRKKKEEDHDLSWKTQSSRTF